MIDIIIPVDYARSSFQLLKNIYSISQIKDDDINLLFAINTRGKFLVKFLTELVIGDRGKVIYENYSGKVNRSKLRNKALEHSTSEFVFLCDVDLVLGQDLLNKIKKEIKKTDFLMVPCLYRRKKFENIDLKTSTLNKIRKNYSHIAIPSSVIVYKKNGIRFDENFIGHGYEDFDFIIRLLKSINRIHITEEYLIDSTYEMAILAQGFREKLGRFCIESLTKEIIIEHRYHKRGNTSEYRDERQRNAKIFHKKVATQIEKSINNKKNNDKLIIDKNFLSKFPGNLILI